MLSTGPVLSLFLLLLAASCRPFFVMMKLVPMATDEAMARPSPIYLCVRVAAVSCRIPVSVYPLLLLLLLLPISLTCLAWRDRTDGTRPESQRASKRVQRVELREHHGGLDALTPAC